MRNFFIYGTLLLFSVNSYGFKTELLAKIKEAVAATRGIKAARPMNAAHVDFLQAPKFAETLDPIAHQGKVEDAVSALGDKIHGSWQAGAKASGKTERFKVLKVDGNMLKTQKELDEYLAKNKIPQEYRNRYKLMDDGKGNIVVHEDILNVPNRYLAPNNQFENTASAYGAVMFVDRWVAAGGVIDANFMRAASNFVHEQWMARNAWAKDSSPELFKPFDELTAVEAKKDTDIVVDALRTYQEQAKLAASAETLSNVGGKLKSVKPAGSTR